MTSIVDVPAPREDDTEPHPSDTTPTTTPDTVESVMDDTDVTSSAGESDRVLYVDPNDVVLADNVREDGIDTLDPNTVRDMRQRGVDTPTSGYRAEDGTVVIVTGQRRVLHAREAGCPLPVWLKQPPAADQRRAGIDRIVQQVNENDLRAPLSLGDQCRAVHQLAAFGLTTRGVARKLSRAVPAVHNMLAVADSQLAVGAAERFDLNLEQAAVVAEFETAGDLDTAKELIRLAVEAPRNFAVVAERQRRNRAENERLAHATTGLTAQLTDAGIPILDQTPSRFTGPARPLDALRPTPDDEPGTELTADTHTDCPGHAAWIDTDWDDHDNRTVVIRYACTDFHSHGHARRHAPRGQAGVPSTAPDSGSGDSDGHDDEAAEQAHLAERAHRRWVIENNKLWDAAVDIRRAWLASFAQRKKAPHGAQQFLATQKTRGGRQLRRAMERGHPLAHTLLNLPQPRYGQPSPLLDKIATATAGKATVYDAFLTLCAHDDDLARDSWRRPTHDAQAYIRALIDWGYNASDIERKILDPDSEPSTPTTSDPLDHQPDTGSDGEAHTDTGNDDSSPVSGTVADTNVVTEHRNAASDDAGLDAA